MEVSSINRQKFIAELSKLLGFMSSWDREATIETYNAMFDAADSEAEVLVMLGSPTKLAIALANEYVPTAAPETKPVEAGEDTDTEAAVLSAVAQAVEEATEESAPAADASALFTDSPETLRGKTAKRARRVRPVALAFYIPVALVIGLPIAVVLIALGVPFLLCGAAIGTIAVWGVLEMIAALTMFSDILLVVGAGMAVVGLGLLLLWFGLWLSIELGCAWLGGVVFRLGSKLCWKKEVPEA